MNRELPDVPAGFRKGRRTRGQIAYIRQIIEKAKEFQKISTSASSMTQKPLTVWITKKNFQEMGIPGHLTCLLRNLYASQEATIRTGHKTIDWFQIGKGVCHRAYLTYMQSTSCKMPGWVKHKLESRLPREISVTSDMQMTPPYGRKQRGTKEPVDEGERGE